jgi:hypothetical protein
MVNETVRVVFRGYPKKGRPREMAYYRHSAFEGRFRRFENDWHLEVTPTYYFSRDRRWPDRYYEDKLTGIKQLETNQAVLGQTVMWAEYLSRDGNLLEPQYPLLNFDELIKFDLDVGMNDEAWLDRVQPDGEDEFPGKLVLFE